jgi:hypothetical protein
MLERQKIQKIKRTEWLLASWEKKKKKKKKISQGVDLL